MKRTRISFLTLYLLSIFINDNINCQSLNASKMNKSRTITGAFSGKTIHLPEVNATSISSIAPERFIKNGKSVADFKLDDVHGFPDVLSFRRKLGLLIPGTNTSMEHELWEIIFNNPSLEGVGIHTTNIQIPKVSIQSEADMEHFKTGFIGSLDKAVKEASMARPEYLIMGMSLEHILYGLKEIRSLMDSLNSNGLSWATWHDAADAALKKYKAKRIGIISPFNAKGNENAIKMFEDMGYEVVASFGFACTDLVDIAHIPDAAKEEAILHHLATPENKLDAVVQLGTNLSMTRLGERLEKQIGIPILPINSVTFWYALRENGFTAPLQKCGRLLREY